MTAKRKDRGKEGPRKDRTAKGKDRDKEGPRKGRIAKTKDREKEGPRKERTAKRKDREREGPRKERTAGSCRDTLSLLCGAIMGTGYPFGPSWAQPPIESTDSFRSDSRRKKEEEATKKIKTGLVTK